jgi:heme-degrading monooxygenase HmoA
MIREVIEHKTKDKEATRKLVKVIEKFDAEARKQPGFVQGDRFLDVTDPCHVVVIALWKTLEELKAWNESKAYKSLTPLLEEHLIERHTTIKMIENVVCKYS